MGEFGQENERLRRIYDQPTWVLTHMDTDSFRSVLEPAYKISRYRLLIAGKGCSSVLYPTQTRAHFCPQNSTVGAMQRSLEEWPVKG